ncbi:MAG: multidrug efflux pump subunit AcrB, partial [Planctomycetota bacterium]
MFAVLAAGTVAYFSMPREVFPEFSLDQIVVTTTYPGASPEDVERQITLPIEEELYSLDDVDEVRSESSESLSIITLELQSGSDPSEVLNEVRSQIQSGALNLPEDSNEPIARELKTEFPVISVFVYGTASEEVIRDVAREQESMIEAIPGVSNVAISGEREPRLWVEVIPMALERYGLTLAQIGALVGAHVRDMPLGNLSTTSGDYLLRVQSDVEGADDLAKLPVISGPDGTIVRLDQVARIRDTFERQYTKTRFNGLPSLLLQVTKQSDGDTIELADRVQELIADQRAHMPPGVSLGTNSDLSIYVRNRLRVMTESGALGGLLVMISLVLFLNVRVAFMTALGIPFAFLGGLLIASAFGVSMNMITMFALIIVLGMIVDDAIVVSENGYRLMEEGLSPKEAAIEGTGQVGAPVIATIMTTIAAFLPILLMDGIIGQFMRPLPLMVTFCLAASLFEALIVLPAHLAHWNSARSVRELRDVAGRHWYEPARDLYARMLALCVKFRYVTLVLSGSVATGFIGYAVLQMPFNLFDDFESKVFYVNIHCKPGTPLSETERLALPIQDEILSLSQTEVESANLLVGILAQDASRFELRQNLAQIWVELREDESDRRSTAEIIEDLRVRFAEPRAGILSIDIDQPQAGPTGKAIDLSIRGPDMAVLEEIAERVKTRLADFAGVRDIRDTADTGKREVEFVLSDEARTLGFNEAWLGTELRSAFEGLSFASIRKGRDDV